MIKTRVYPGETINLNPSDLNHSGSNLRNFELVAAQEAVKNENLAMINSDYKETEAIDTFEIVNL
jgi:hypothetical protein